jgi:hypothetical protein
MAEPAKDSIIIGEMIVNLVGPDHLEKSFNTSLSGPMTIFLDLRKIIWFKGFSGPVSPGAFRASASILWSKNGPKKS